MTELDVFIGILYLRASIKVNLRSRCDIYYHVTLDGTHLLAVRMLIKELRTSNESVSTRRAQLSVTAKAVRLADLLNLVKT